MKPSAPIEPESSTLEVMRQYLGAMRRHLGILLGVTVVCVGLAAYKAYNDPPEYRASAVIRMNDSRRMIPGAMGAAALARTGLGDPIKSQLEILRSRAVTGMVVDTLGMRLIVDTRGLPASALQDVRVEPAVVSDTVTVQFTADGMVARARDLEARAAYGEPLRIGGVRFTVKERPAVDDAVLLVASREQAAQALLNNLGAENRYSTDIIDVSYVAHDPVMAQRVVNSVVESFQAFNASVAQQEARRRREFVEQQLAETDSALMIAQTALTAFQRQEQAFSSKDRFVAEQTWLLDLQSEHAKLQADQRMYQLLLTSLQRSQNDARDRGVQTLMSSPELAANPAIAQLYSQLVQYQTARDTLVTGGRAPTDPSVVQLESLISGTQSRLASAVNSHITSIEARIASLGGLISRNTSAIQTLPASAATEVQLQSRVEYVTDIARELRQNYQQAKIEEAIQGGQIDIIDPALPGAPISGGRIRTILFGLVFGLALGGGVGVLVENLNTRIRRKDEVEQLLHVAELAVIPAFGAGAVAGGLRLPSALRRNGVSAPSRDGSDLVAALDLQSPGAEAYRTLRTNLLFSQAVQSLRSMVITSSAPSEGKSTTAANLAVTFAQQGLRVLLVDCDLRKARLHKVFRVPREPGFTQLVLGMATPDELIHPTPVDGLSFLASGTLPPNPAELLGGPPMRLTIDQLKQRFDMVVFDTPPLLAAADAAILATLVDGAVLVVRAGQTERAAARQAVQKLRQVNARLLGAVLNDPDSKVAAYGGHYVYEYYGSER